MESALDWHQAKALLEWYVELGVTDAVAEAPIDRYELPPEAPKTVAKPKAAAPEAQPLSVVPDTPRIDWVAEAKTLAARADSLEALAEALQAFEGSPLKKGARNFVFADGNPAARVMIVGEGPDEEEDREGLPFVGRAGHLLDAMFAAIDMSRAAPDAQQSIYITGAVPWRRPGDRAPTEAEMDMFRPFLMRHIELADPDIVVPMGNAACLALLGRQGIARIRGQWAEVADRPVLPMFHPSHLHRMPAAKREAWADLLTLQARLREMAP
ncbi:uracil-DNA glycosylase [Maritimibacter dapengensis]|uniref:uracil-DNA glycosylase n=1 Tax=Maritimibacter dapengensis TaxID=2836868 RepID=A0ABS6SXZ0_9RHOB|nr:uracil-DNA glycosylase [Maritimibacter dapengensis]MBV7377373.1 uracil-DNA glycosylase [Maritimibacter dapengensis]